MSCELSFTRIRCKMFYCTIPALLGDTHYLFYWLVPAIQPRMLVTLDESLSSIGVSVRVGQVKLLMLKAWSLIISGFTFRR